MRDKLKLLVMVNANAKTVNPLEISSCIEKYIRNGTVYSAEQIDFLDYDVSDRALYENEDLSYIRRKVLKKMDENHIIAFEKGWRDSPMLMFLHNVAVSEGKIILAEDDDIGAKMHKLVKEEEMKEIYSPISQRVLIVADQNKLSPSIVNWALEVYGKRYGGAEVSFLNMPSLTPYPTKNLEILTNSLKIMRDYQVFIFPSIYERNRLYKILYNAARDLWLSYHIDNFIVEE